MIPLSVVNQSQSNDTIVIDVSSSNGLSLDEWYKQKKGKYPTSRVINFLIEPDVYIVAPDTKTPAIIEGPHWPAGSEINILNKGKILGRGGDGGVGAMYYPTRNGAFKTIAAKDGTAGGPAIRVSTTNCVVVNQGYICGGGGGGGGGPSWTYNDGTWCGWRNGTIAGGGAPMGKRSIPVGSIDWLLGLPETSGWWAKIDTTIANTNKKNPEADPLHRGSAHTIIFNGHQSHNRVRIHVSSNDFFYLFFNAITIGGISPILDMTGIDGVFFPRYEKATFTSDSLREKYEHPDDMYRSFCSEYGGIRAAYSYIPPEATIEQLGNGGYSIGCSFDGADAWLMLRNYNQFPATTSMLPDGFDGDVVGGNGGAWGMTGDYGSVNHYLLTNYKPWNKRHYKKVQPADLHTRNLNTLPSGKPGLAGYIKIGNVSITNVDGGITKGR